MPMLLPDNIHPEQSIYYNGAFVLEALREQSASDITGPLCEHTSSSPNDHARIRFVS